MFPKTNFGSRNPRSCQHSCFDNHPWMHYGIEKDCEVCFYCMKKVSKLTAGKNKEPAYISVEFKNWKKTPERFKDHQNSKCHKEAEHCVKSVRIRSYSGPHFSRLCRIRTEYGEILRISLYSVRM